RRAHRLAALALTREPARVRDLELEGALDLTLQIRLAFWVWTHHVVPAPVDEHRIAAVSPAALTVRCAIEATQINVDVEIQGHHRCAAPSGGKLAKRNTRCVSEAYACSFFARPYEAVNI